jgi:hypothetical protein
MRQGRERAVLMLELPEGENRSLSKGAGDTLVTGSFFVDQIASAS